MNTRPLTKKVEIRDVGLSGIAVTPNRMRSLRTDVVKELADSIKRVGLLNPITVRASEGIGYYLVAGRHRLEAVKVLGLPSILCRILPADTDDNAARMAEIDENLQRAELSPAETAAHIAERKRIYEAIRGPAKAIGGRARHKVKDSANANLADAESFTEDTAKKTGKSKRKVQRDAQRGEEIGADALSKVVGTSLDKGDELDALGKLDKPARDDLIDRAAKGEKVSAKTGAKKQKRAAPASPDHAPTGNSADPAEAANLARGLLDYLSGMAPIVEQILEIGAPQFWKQIGSKALRSELGLALGERALDLSAIDRAYDALLKPGKLYCDDYADDSADTDNAPPSLQ
jgi:ParB/RepB/Spo0J family partition protein